MKVVIPVGLALAIVLLNGEYSFAHYDDGSDNVHSTKTTQSTTSPWHWLEVLIAQPAYASSLGVAITVEGRFRYVRSNGLPDHATGQFPSRGCPNTIYEQEYVFRMPSAPKATGEVTPLGHYPFGVALNGIPFDPFAREFWHNDSSSGWQYEAMSLGHRLGLDASNAHVQPNGAYHYHGLPTGLLDKLASLQRPLLIGYAADGFPIYGPFDQKGESSMLAKMRSSYRVKEGIRPSGPGGEYSGLFVQDYEYVQGLGDLDECNGRFGPTPEYPNGIYHYIVTDTYPYIPRAFQGTPDQTFMAHGHPRRPAQFGNGNGGPPPLGSGSGNGNGGPPPWGGGSGDGGPPPWGGGNGNGGPPPLGGGSGNGGPPPLGSGNGNGGPPPLGGGSGNGGPPPLGSGSGDGGPPPLGSGSGNGNGGPPPWGGGSGDGGPPPQ